MKKGLSRLLFLLYVMIYAAHLTLLKSRKAWLRGDLPFLFLQATQSLEEVFDSSKSSLCKHPLLQDDTTKRRVFLTRKDPNAYLRQSGRIKEHFLCKGRFNASDSKSLSAY